MDANLKKELLANKVTLGDKSLSNAFFKTTYQSQNYENNKA